MPWIFPFAFTFPTESGFKIILEYDWTPMIEVSQNHHLENLPKETFSFQLSKFFFKFRFYIWMEFLPYFSEFFPWIVSKLVDYIGTVSDIGILSTNWPDEPQKVAKTMYTAGWHSRLYFISFDNPNFQKTWAAECQWINFRHGYFTTNIIRQFQHFSYANECQRECDELPPNGPFGGYMLVTDVGDEMLVTVLVTSTIFIN